MNIEIAFLLFVLLNTSNFSKVDLDKSYKTTNLSTEIMT